MSYMASSLFSIRKCAHKVGAGLCVGCMMGISQFYGVRSAKIPKVVPDVTQYVMPYRGPGVPPFRGPDDGHYEVSTSTATVSAAAAWGQPLAVPALAFPPTDPTSGQMLSAPYVVSADGSI